MGWTDPRTWTDGELVTAGIMNPHVRDNFLAMGPHLVVRKTVDESLASNTTLQDDDHLILPALASETYRVHYGLIIDAPTAADVKLAFTFPSGRVDFSITAVDETGTATFRRWNTATSPTTAVALFGAGGPMNYDLFGVFANGGTAGNLVLQWAQNTSNATATTMKANSTLWAVKLA